jgi:hypothetical protein
MLPSPPLRRLRPQLVDDELHRVGNEMAALHIRRARRQSLEAWTVAFAAEASRTS